MPRLPKAATAAWCPLGGVARRSEDAVRPALIGQETAVATNVFIAHGRIDDWLQLKAVLEDLGLAIAEFNGTPAARRLVPRTLEGNVGSVTVWVRTPGAKRPNHPNSTTQPAGRADGNRNAIAGFAAAHGQEVEASLSLAT